MLLKPEQRAAPQAAQFPLSAFEFVALMALLMALTALTVDVMLPALPQIGRSLGVANGNDRQLVVSIYLGGFALGQLIFGPASDRFGRKPPLLVGLALYTCGTLLAVASSSFPGLLAARVLQGMGAASPRVIALAIVRDRFEGREMSRVMSFITMVFIVVPMLAPGVGEGILLFSGWRSIFALLLMVALGSAVWVTLRLPETRHAEDRLPLSASALWRAIKLVTVTRQTIGYVIAMGFIFGLLISYVMSSEQIFVEVYRPGRALPHRFRLHFRLHDRRLRAQRLGRAHAGDARHLAPGAVLRARRVRDHGAGAASRKNRRCYCLARSWPWFSLASA